MKKKTNTFSLCILKCLRCTHIKPDCTCYIFPGGTSAPTCTPVFTPLNPVNTTLQSKEKGFIIAISIIHSVLNSFNDMKNKEVFNEVLRDLDL